MSMQFTESFASAAVTSDLLRKWSGLGGGALTTTGGVLGGNALQWVNSASPATVILWPSGKVSVTLYTGFWFKISAAPAANTNWFGMLSQGQGWCGGFGIATSGQLFLNNGQSSTAYGASFKNVCDNNWHWLESSMALPATSTAGGTIVWYLDTFYQMSVNINNIFAYNVNVFSIGFWLNGLAGAGLTTTVDKIFINDSNAPLPGASQFPMGPQVISALRPASDSAVAFTPNTGSTNYTQVNETVPDDDASYVQSNGGSGNQDLYGYGALGFTPTSIGGVMVNTRLKNPNPGSVSYNIAGKSASVTRLGPTTVAPVNYTSLQQEFGVDPNTSALWTPSGLGSATFGVKAP